MRLFLLLAVLAAASCSLIKGTGKVAYGTAKVATKVAYGTAKVGTKVAIGTVKVAATVVKDMAYYTARAAFYKKNHDSSDDYATGSVHKVVGRHYGRFPDYKGDWRWPLGAGIVSSEFGERWHKHHEGIDIAADEGEPVYASAAGKVIYADHRMRGYGNVIILRHDSRMTSLYAHNSKLEVKLGDTVAQGQEIALLGNTGHSTGPHVHFEFRKANVPQNPRALLPKSEF